MAGYVFAIGGDTEIIKICAERGVYATRLNSLASRPFEATLADYVSMKPGDNVELTIMRQSQQEYKEMKFDITLTVLK